MQVFFYEKVDLINKVILTKLKCANAMYTLGY